MSKKCLLILSGLVAAAALSGCGQKSTPETEFSTAAPAAEASEDVDPESLTEATEATEDLEPITPSDYLVENVSEYVTLGDLTGLAVDQYSYDVTDDMVQERILSDLEASGEEVEVDRAAAEGDIVYADVTSTVHGEPDTEYTESTYLTLGDAEYSEEFDEELIGASSGDQLKFTCSFDGDTWMEEWANKSVDFEVTVTSVCEMDVPEYTDEYVAENTDFANKAEYEENVREQLTSEYEESSYSDAVEVLFQTAIDESQFSGYPEELYDSCKTEVLSIYSAFLGTTDEQEIYEAFDLSEDDIASEVLDTINRRLLVSAICEENDIEVSEDDYVQFVTDYAEYYGYDSAVQFEEDNTRESLVWSLYENEAAALLYESAEITLVPYEEMDEDFTFDDEETIEDDTDSEVLTEADTDDADANGDAESDAADDTDGETESADANDADSETESVDANDTDSETESDTADDADGL